VRFKVAYRKLIRPSADIAAIAADDPKGPIMITIGRLAAAVLVYRYASLAVAAAGAYWLVERIGFE
jgi:hypothetical protein